MDDWHAIVDKHGSHVWRTVYRLLNHHSDALDCCQETLLSAYRYAQKHDVQDWGSFLASLAARRAIDHLRQRIRLRARFVQLETLPESPTDENLPFQQASAADLMQRVREEMPRLPDTQAEVFWLICIEGLTHQQVSEQMQITTGDVRVLLHRARKRLQSLLGSTVLDERGNP